VFKRHLFFPIGLFYPPYGNFVQRLAFKLYLGEPDRSLIAASPRETPAMR